MDVGAVAWPPLFFFHSCHQLHPASSFAQDIFFWFVKLYAVNLNTEAELYIPVQQEQGGVGHDDDHEGEHGGDGDRDDEADLGDAHGRHFEFRARIRSRPMPPHILPSNRLVRTHPVIPAVFLHFFCRPRE